MKPEKTLSITSVNKHLSRVVSIFDWAVRHGYCSTNPFTGLTIKQKRMARDARDPFSSEELAKLFAATLFQEKDFKHPYQYWLPYMGLFTGARLEELASLTISDFQKIDGVDVISINEEGDKRLKNLSSKRFVPIARRLKELGLLKFVKEQKEKGEEDLFPELPRRRDGKGQDASRWFGRFRKTVGVESPFHSFRHTVVDHLKQKNVPKEKIAALVGHSDDSMTTGRYGSSYGPKVLLEVVEKLVFEV